MTTTDADDSAESWLSQSLSTRPRSGWLAVEDGIRVRTREWGALGMPGVVLVHGGAAHSQWWDHIAPWLATTRHVVALDLSGHGDSDWRPDGYSVDAWGREVLAAAELVSAAGAPALVGHSMGGLVSLRAALEPDAHLAGVVTLDTSLRPIGEGDASRRRARTERVSVYPTQRAAVESFRTLPAGGSHRHLPSLVRHIAETSVRQTPEGWTWKLDRRIWLRKSFTLEDLRSVDHPVLVVAAQHGMLTRDRADAITRRLGPLARSVTLPLAGHHVMLDQPAAVTACLDAALATWTCVSVGAAEGASVAT